jgi:hypothetical protein
MDPSGEIKPKRDVELSWPDTFLFFNENKSSSVAVGWELVALVDQLVGRALLRDGQIRCGVQEFVQE